MSVMPFSLTAKEAFELELATISKSRAGYEPSLSVLCGGNLRAMDQSRG